MQWNWNAKNLLLRTMTPIKTLPELKEYLKKLDRQKEILQMSPAFTANDKKDITDIYAELSIIVGNRIAAYLDVIDALEL